jgi:hypothetical protein
MFVVVRSSLIQPNTPCPGSKISSFYDAIPYRQMRYIQFLCCYSFSILPRVSGLFRAQKKHKRLHQ